MPIVRGVATLYAVQAASKATRIGIGASRLNWSRKASRPVSAERPGSSPDGGKIDTSVLRMSHLFTFISFSEKALQDVPGLEHSGFHRLIFELDRGLAFRIARSLGLLEAAFHSWRLCQDLDRITPK